MKIIQEFEEIVDNIFGVYLDSTLGFRRVVEWINKNQELTIEDFKTKNPKIANIDYLDNQPFFYGKGNPNIPSSVVLHQTTQKQLKKRNSENGTNFIFIGNLVIVAIYQYWEDNYRSKIASLFNKNKNEIISPIIGDLRILRTSILHHHNIALKDVEKCIILKWFKFGDHITIDKDKMEIIIYYLKIYLNRLKYNLKNNLEPSNAL
jgi:hypothetical protein